MDNGTSYTADEPTSPDNGASSLAAYCGAVGRLKIAERALADGNGLVAPVGPNGYRQ